MKKHYKIKIPPKYPDKETFFKNLQKDVEESSRKLEEYRQEILAKKAAQTEISKEIKTSTLTPEPEPEIKNLITSKSLNKNTQVLHETFAEDINTLQTPANKSTEQVAEELNPEEEPRVKDIIFNAGRFNQKTNKVKESHALKETIVVTGIRINQSEEVKEIAEKEIDKSNTVMESQSDNLNENHDIVLFKNMIKNIAQNRLKENKKHLETTERNCIVRYSKNNDEELKTDALIRLKRLIEKDIDLKKREHALEEKYKKAANLHSSKNPSFSRSSNDELSMNIKLWEREYHKAKDMRIVFLRLYPELDFIDRNNIENKSDQEIYSCIKNGFKDIKDSIENIRKRINDKEELLTKIKPVINEAMKELGIDKEHDSVNMLCRNVNAWLQKQSKIEEQYKISGTALSVTLSMNVFFTLPEGEGVPLLLAGGRALTGASPAVSSFQSNSNFWDISEIQNLYNKDIIDPDDQEQKKFDYVMGMANLVIAGLDIVLAGKGVFTRLKFESVVRRLAGAADSGILAGLLPDHIIRLEYLMRLESSREKILADKVIQHLKAELKHDYNKAYMFFVRNKDLFVESRIRINTRKKLYSFKFQQDDIEKILDMLDMTEEGNKIRSYINNERFINCEGYEGLLLRIKRKDESVKVLQAMEEADVLMNSDSKEISFHSDVKLDTKESNR